MSDYVLITTSSVWFTQVQPATGSICWNGHISRFISACFDVPTVDEAHLKSWCCHSYSRTETTVKLFIIIIIIIIVQLQMVYSLFFDKANNKRVSFSLKINNN